MWCVIFLQLILFKFAELVWTLANLWTFQLLVPQIHSQHMLFYLPSLSPQTHVITPLNTEPEVLVTQVFDWVWIKNSFYLLSFILNIKKTIYLQVHWLWAISFYVILNIPNFFFCQKLMFNFQVLNALILFFIRDFCLSIPFIDVCFTSWRIFQ